MAGTFTPESISREGSPIPEGMEGGGGDTIVQSSSSMVTHSQLIAAAHSAPDLCRISQSAPGSPAGKKEYIDTSEDETCKLGVIYIINLNF